VPVDGVGAQLFPCSLATDTPQAFSVALVLPIQQGSEVALVITDEGVHCRPAPIHQVWAGSYLEGVPPLVRSHLHLFPSRLPDPDRLVVPIRPVVVRAAPTRSLRFQGQAALSFGTLLRQDAGGPLSPTRTTHRLMAARLGV